MTRLIRKFFTREATDVARDLLGRTLVHDLNGTRIAGKIVEAEAYSGFDDKASHAHRGPTVLEASPHRPVQDPIQKHPGSPENSVHRKDMR